MTAGRPFLLDYPDPLNVGDYRRPSAGWAAQPAVRDRHRAALLTLASRPFDPPAMSGRGVLIAGGGRHWHMGVALCRLLREVGCTLPVQWWYRGSCEPVQPRQVAGLGVELVDADAVPAAVAPRRLPRGCVNPGGWEAKSKALALCPWEEVLWLDNDVAPLADPTPLFDDLRPAPIAYWHEDWSRNIRWADLGWPGGKPAGCGPGLQAGQFVVDRRRAWPAVVLAYWMAHHSDYFYPADRRLLWGDQDALLLGLWLTGTPAAVLGPFEHRPGLGGTCRHRGRPLFEHYYDAKLVAPPGPHPGWAAAARHVAALLAESVGADRSFGPPAAE